MGARLGFFIIFLIVLCTVMASLSARGLPTVKAFSVRNARMGQPFRTFSSADVINKNTFVWPAGIVNRNTIARLINCESGWANVRAMDSDGIPSDGILQFHEDGTWQAMSRLSDITGDPMNPTEAIIMADWMISNGYLKRWTCAHILDIVK